MLVDEVSDSERIGVCDSEAFADSDKNSDVVIFAEIDSKGLGLNEATDDWD